MAISIQAIKNEIAKSGTNKGKFIFFKEETKIRLRFLNDMEDGVEIPFHDSFKLGVNVPCQEMFGRECSYCEDEDLRTRNMYVWSVYDYESKEVKLFMFAVNNCSPVPALASMYETYGTITDRDFEIKRIGKGQNTTYSVIPLDKKKFRNEKVKPMSEQAILKAIDKAYPADNSEIEEDEEKPTRAKTKGRKTKTKVEPEPEIEEETEDYEEMSARELYQMCKERGLDCKPRKTKEYYIDILEEDDEEQDDDWDDEETEDDDWD